MRLRPRVGVQADHLEWELQAVATSCADAAASLSEQLVSRYLRWVVNAEKRLRPVLRIDDLEELLLTRRYWAIYANPRGSSTAAQLELESRRQALEDAAADIRRRRIRWRSQNSETAHIVADTNVYLHHPRAVDEIDWLQCIGLQGRVMTEVRLAIPVLVIDELDDNKREKSRERARATLKQLYLAFGTQPEAPWELKARDRNHGGVIAQLLLDDPSHVRLPRPDDELVDRCVELQSYVSDPVHFVSYDTGAVLRARAAGLTAHRLAE